MLDASWCRAREEAFEACWACGARFVRVETGTDTADPPSSVKGSLSSSELYSAEGLRWTLLASLVALGMIFARSSCASEDYAVCSTDGKIYTVDAAHPHVQCLVVRDNIIADVGDLADVKARWHKYHTGRNFAGFQLPYPLGFWQPSLNVSIIEPNSIVVPGLTDAHAHVLQYGAAMNLDLAGCKSKQEVLQRLVNHVKSHQPILSDPSRWIIGMGWDQNLWSDPHYPHATQDDFDLEPLLRGRRIYLDRVDVHAAWVSNRVLQLMGDLPEEVDGGVIIRDASRKPTGIFVDNAMALIPVPAPTRTQLLEYFDRTVKDAHAVGLTSIHDAATEPYMIEFYQDRPCLKLRLYLMGNMESNEYWGNKIPRLIDYGVGGRLNLRSVKLFTDGALGSYGAALLEPYSDNLSTSGIMRVQPQTLLTLVKQFWADGWQVNIHCIGDRANQVVLDIFEHVLSDVEHGNATDRRPRIEHAQIMTLEDLQRIGRLGVIPSVQPTHATSDMWYAEQRLGPERIKGAYGYQTMIQASKTGILPLGSDFPVEGINPLLGFYAAVSRLSPSGTSPHGSQGWYPSERLKRAQALKGMTLDAAYASFAEEHLGSLSIGKKADFVVLDRDIMTVPVSEILDTRVTATVIDGEVVYGNL
ncbi:amidohydrolase family-domain-containing protein [Melanogaster broomeanus]|nr:amidohydrolase family-domain-containing protein [Melanogaster broomeanus]